jgi:tetratricopeptide (TPR) repeat protein
MLAYLKYMKTGLQMRDYWLSLGFFLASLFSKSAAVTLPLILIAFDIYKGRKFNTKSILEKIPFIALSLLFGILTILSQKTQGSINIQMLTFNPVTRFFFLTSAMSFYFIKFIFPFNLSAMNYYPILHNGVLPWQYYASIILIIFIAWFVLKKSVLRKEIIFGVSFFLIAISVMLQILSVGSALTAERYTYISYIGLFYVVGQWISSLGIGRRKNIVIAVFSLFILVFSVQTFGRISVWQNAYTINEDIIEHNPDVFIGYWMRGNLKRTENDMEGALQDYTKAIKLDPFNDDSYYNRGNIYDRIGDPKSAILDYDKAIKYNPNKPDAYNNRGWAYFETGDTKAALEDINKAITMSPKYVQAYNNRGWIRFKANDFKAALPDFNKAIEIQPDYVTAYYNRAMVKTAMTDYIGAIADYNSLLTLRPKDSNIYYNMGINYLGMRDTADACKQWSFAISMGNTKAQEVAGQYCH